MPRMQKELDSPAILQDFSPETKRLFAEFLRSARADGLVYPQRYKLLPPEERARVLADAGYNLSLVDAWKVHFDGYTDSGTMALSDEQLLEKFKADHSYAGKTVWEYGLKPMVQKVFRFPYVLPAHQGRAAESLLFQQVITKKKPYVLGNTPFDTTSYWIEFWGGVVVDCIRGGAYAEHYIPFNGDVDTDKLASALKRHEGKVACVLLTITCNSAGGQPVSLGNVGEVWTLCSRYGIPLYFDAARFAQNAYFNCIRECGHPLDNTIQRVVWNIMSCAAGMVMSAKKECANMGGIIALRDKRLAEQIEPHVITREGHPTYGGMDGETIAAVSLGIQEAMHFDRLHQRIEQVRYLRENFAKEGVPVLQPGGHAVFVDAGRLLPHIPWHQFPGQSLATALYQEGAVRSVEIGSFMKSRSPKTGKNRKAPRELTRIAIPARVYDQEDLDYVVEVMRGIMKDPKKIRGMRIVKEAPGIRHFKSHLLPVR